MHGVPLRFVSIYNEHNRFKLRRWVTLKDVNSFSPMHENFTDLYMASDTTKPKSELIALISPNLTIYNPLIIRGQHQLISVPSDATQISGCDPNILWASVIEEIMIYFGISLSIQKV